MTTALVYGLGIAGRSAIGALTRRGWSVLATDDVLDDDARRQAGELGADVIDAVDVGEALGDVDTVVPAPGVPETHPLFAAAAEAGSVVVSEIELAYRFEQERTGGPRPMLAVTGTDGKTTTTLLAAAMLEAAGRRPIVAGNTDVTLLEALDLDIDVFVVEASSFRLRWTEQFRSEAAVWLNFAEDHLNWHESMASYEAAKSRIFSLQGPSDTAIGFVDDDVVMRHVRRAPGPQRSFGLTGADYRIQHEALWGPGGELAPLTTMGRCLPHDLTNALAAAALTIETGLATSAAVAGAVGDFRGPAHRLELVADHGGVRWFDDSKATTPHAASVAMAAFDRVVLIAGGLNKGLDLGPMARQAHRVRAVVAIGQDAADIAAVFQGHCPVIVAEDMGVAVDRAAELVRPGDVVLLSPGCASFDWYTGYAARGDDFRHRVEALGGLVDPSTQGAPT
ncbi:MAG: UDP-N-acetylmuramoyl-L-alanine--D-glutamate ligase [Acidimicrobiia bacterium]|nr:UDP-N-acetylmuramoyl-L-alanine--D-glutamate ligase [Acidimicrobiia bacterium]MBA3982150.1 UDP-N-acetylmuramoyl-L-alanine--D-glutamate ligase [Acidimicrobiia bacterium]MDQ3390200.1 UDP-N-acetylmuramoyl-L-alanine--D-glutamate ligase [Actinomycetota bacterium]